MTHEAVLFTLHSEMTFPRLFLGIAIAGLIVLFASVLVKQLLDNAQDRGYEQGYDAYANEVADNMAEEISEELEGFAKSNDPEEYFRRFDN